MLSAIPRFAFVICRRRSVVHQGTKLVVSVKESLWSMYCFLAFLLVSVDAGVMMLFRARRRSVPQREKVLY